MPCIVCDFSIPYTASPVSRIDNVQNREVFRKASLGPDISSSCPYPIRSNTENGVTKAMAKDKLDALVNPMVSEVKILSPVLRANS